MARPRTPKIGASPIEQLRTSVLELTHSINNPLSATVANVDLALRLLAKSHDGPVSAQDCERLSDWLADAKEGAARVNQLVRDLTALGKSTGG